MTTTAEDAELLDSAREHCLALAQLLKQAPHLQGGIMLLVLEHVLLRFRERLLTRKVVDPFESGPPKRKRARRRR